MKPDRSYPPIPTKYTLQSVYRPFEKITAGISIPRDLINTSRQRAALWQRCASKAEAVKKGIVQPNM